MEDYNFNTKKKWENSHKIPRFQVKYPNERAIQFLFRSFDRNNFGKIKILDHGCGAGRHVIFLAENGVKTFGADVSETGLDFTKELLKKKNLKAELSLISGNKLEYADNFFDGVVSFGVIYYMTLKDAEETVKEIWRVLKPGGKAFFTIRSDKDYRFGRGKKVGKNTFIINESDKSLNVSNENGMIMHFFEKEEIKKMFSVFSKIEIDQMLNTYNNKKTWDHDYVVTCEK